MIVSHSHKFIYLKCRKVGSTSVEMVLGDICGPEDIITPLDGEKTRERAERERNWQNHEVPRERWPLSARILVALGVDRRRAGVELFNHIRAKALRRLIGPEVFDSYYKIAIERNPWDREVSNYFFKYPRDPRPSFTEFVTRETVRKPIDNFDIYSIDGKIVADMVMQHERLDADLAEFMRRIGCETPPELPRARSRQRPEKGDYRSHYTAETRDIVAKLYAREIAAFGYEF